MRDLEGRVRTILLRPDRDHSDTVAGVLATLRDEVVVVNPFATRDDPLPLSVEERTRRLDALLR
ncbi:MAG: hypothetical protein H6734_28415 [Alphaproteobacteria bacterium]|nr:hypothetical protein [Alphaproteobacteria bacterium]